MWEGGSQHKPVFNNIPKMRQKQFSHYEGVFRYTVPNFRDRERPVHAASRVQANDDLLLRDQPATDGVSEYAQQRIEIESGVSAVVFQVGGKIDLKEGKLIPAPLSRLNSKPS